MAHVITIVTGLSKLWRNAMSGRPSLTTRWKCSCGRVGVEQSTARPDRAKRRAEIGGRRHVRAATGRRQP